MQYNHSPSPSPGPQGHSPPHPASPYSAAHSSTPNHSSGTTNSNSNTANGSAGGATGGGFNSPLGQTNGPARYSLLNKLQHGNHQAVYGGHHAPQHSYNYANPGNSPGGYNNSHSAHNSMQLNSIHSNNQSNSNLTNPQSNHVTGGNNSGGGNLNQQRENSVHSQLHQNQQQQLHHSNHPQSQTGPPHGPHSGNGPISSHWQQQLNLAHLSRQANSPHHNARAAHLAARGQTTAAIAITDPNNRPSSAVPGSKALTYGTASTPTNASHRKETSAGKSDDLSVSPTTSANELIGPGVDLAKGEKNSWTTIDLGGMNLKNISLELFRYHFLTILYIPHNSLNTLPAQISRLSNLTTLDASSNKLTQIPSELGLLTKLRELLLFDNHLTSLPAELGTLHQLDTLGIEGNPLPDTLRSLLEKEGTSSLIAYLRDSCPVPLPPPERDWVTIEPDSFPAINSGKPPEATFSVLCYNILCEKYATAQVYGYTPSWALAWDYRKELILQEVLNYSADILCLQEVDIEQYENYFLSHLEQQDYDGVHFPKTRARTMSGEEKRTVDGCAIFFKNKEWAMVEQHHIEFNQIAMRRSDFKKTEDMFNRVMTKDHIAVVVLLEHRQSGARLIVANTHVEWRPEFRDVKLVQVAMLMDELTKIGNDFARLPSRLNLGAGYDKAPTYTNGTKIPTIVCGDFNSPPDSGVYEFMSRAEVEKDHADFMGHIYGNYTSEGLKHKLQLKSAYSNIGELPFTNYTPGFQDTISYLFYTQNSLGVTGLLGQVDKEYLQNVVGFPNAHWPSDHISLLAEFKLKH